MGRNLENEGLVEPCPPTPTPLASHCGNRSSIIICQFHWLGLLAQHEIPSSLRSNCVPWAQSIRPSIGAVEKEIIEIRPENWKATLTRIGFEGGVDHGGDKLVLIDNEADRTGAPQHSNANQEPVALGVLILLRLVQQHRRKPQKTKNSKTNNSTQTRIFKNQGRKIRKLGMGMEVRLENKNKKRKL